MFNNNYSKKKKAADILGVDLNASDIEIKKAYKNAALKWHPDKNTNNIIEASNKFKEISSAYKILTFYNDTINTNFTDNMENNDIYSNLASNFFEDIIFSFDELLHNSHVNKKNNFFTEEEEINIEANELYNYLNFMEKNKFKETCDFIPNNIYVFGPKDIDQHNKNLEEISLNFRVRIDIIDIWKNTKKILLVKNKYNINLPLYYNDIKFINSIKKSDNILKNIEIEIVDKYSDNLDVFFKRRGKWDLETIKHIPLNDLYKDCILNIELPDKTIKKIQWKKIYISNFKNENIKGFFLYDYGLPVPCEKNTKEKTGIIIPRGKLWVKISIILPDTLTNEKEEVEKEEVKKEEVKKEEVEKEEVEKEEVEKEEVEKYLIPEWVSSKDWNIENGDRNITLNLDDYIL